MARILIVDDDPILLRVYTSKLTSEGFTVEAVGDGAAALMAIAAKPPEVVLLDLMLPDLSGVEIIRRVRAREAGSHLPIVVLSNLYLEEESVAARAAGADLVLAKASTTPRKVVEAVRGVLSVLAPPPARALPIAPPLPPAQTQPAQAPVALPVLPVLPVLPAVPAGDPRIVRGAAALDIAPRTGRTAREGSESYLRAETFLPQVELLLQDATRLLATLSQDPAALTNLGRTCKHLGNRAIAAQRWDVAKLAAASESLVHQIKESPRYLTPSTVRTLTQAVARFRTLATADQAATDLAAFNTLVLDDEGVSRATMGLALGKVGLQGTPVADPRAALEVLKTTRFQLILSDVMMNGMSGFQFATQARALPGYARTPIIFVTALGDFDSRAAANRTDDLIAKPFLLMELGTKALLQALGGERDPWQAF